MCKCETDSVMTHFTEREFVCGVSVFTSLTVNYRGDVVNVAPRVINLIFLQLQMTDA